MPTKKEIGRAVEVVRKANGWQNRTVFAAQLNLLEGVVYNRESGRAHVNFGDIFDYAKVLGLSPDEYVRQVVEQCDREWWADVATELGCTVRMARKRLGDAGSQFGLSERQVWKMYMDRQIRL